MNPTRRSLRIVIAKPGLDGHDVGAKVVARALVDAGHEVVYTGLRQSPEAIANTARQEDADLVGLSILSGSHLPLTRKVREALDRLGLGEVPLLVGGNIPRKDHEALRALGVRAVFPTGTSFEEIRGFIEREFG